MVAYWRIIAAWRRLVAANGVDGSGKKAARGNALPLPHTASCLHTLLAALHHRHRYTAHYT